MASTIATESDIATDNGTVGLINSSYPSIPQADSAFVLSRLLSAAPSSCKILLVIAVARHFEAMIPTRDLLFCVLFPSYLMLANRLRFASNLTIRQRPADHPHNASVVTSRLFSGSDSAWFKRYMLLAATIGLVMPLVTVARARREVASLAAPHLFVLCCQIIGESMTKFNTNSHRFVTLLVFVGFSVYRMNLLVEWFLGSVSLYWDGLRGWGGHSGMEDVLSGHGWGLALSSLNLAFWTYNLFVTILLKIVPEYLSDEKCESPDVPVISLPFIKETAVSPKCTEDRNL
jgi:hypothetical protein